MQVSQHNDMPMSYCVIVHAISTVCKYKILNPPEVHERQPHLALGWEGNYVCNEEIVTISILKLGEDICKTNCNSLGYNTAVQTMAKIILEDSSCSMLH
jgi:hypothetical protein